MLFLFGECNVATMFETTKFMGSIPARRYFFRNEKFNCRTSFAFIIFFGPISFGREFFLFVYDELVNTVSDSEIYFFFNPTRR